MSASIGSGHDQAAHSIAAALHETETGQEEENADQMCEWGMALWAQTQEDFHLKVNAA